MDKIEDITGKINYLKTYEIPYITGKYILEIVEEKEEGFVEFWLYEKTYGIKKFLTGILKKDYTEEFENNLISTIDEEIKLYREEYED